VLTTFAQNYLGNLACIRMLQIRSNMVLFMRSTTPFCEGFSEPSSLYGFPDLRRTFRIWHHSIHPHCQTSST